MNNGSQYFPFLICWFAGMADSRMEFHHVFVCIIQCRCNLADVANIDGANRWQKIKNILWRTIKPTTTILLIINLEMC